jgi:hypothetical protein
MKGGAAGRDAKPRDQRRLARLWWGSPTRGGRASRGTSRVREAHRPRSGPRCEAARPASVASRWWGSNPTTLVWRTSVSPQHFTCLAVSEETCGRGSSWAPGARPMTRTWVEWESNPRFDGVRIRCKPAFATDPIEPSHPLGSNQNLSVFSRARRPTTQEWEEDAARYRWEAGTARRRCYFGCLPWHPSSSSTLRLSESTGVRSAHLGRWRVRVRSEHTPRVLMILIA